MAVLTIPNTFTDGTLTVAADVNANFTAIGSAINGGLDTSNLSASAGIVGSQLASSTITATQLATSAVATAKLLDPLIKVTEITVTPADMVALFSTPKTLLEAPGAGYAHVFFGATARLKYGGTAYATAANVIVRYATPTTISTTLTGAGFFHGTTNATTTHKVITTDVSVQADTAIQLQGSANFTLGNSYVYYKVWYATIPTEV